jgi:hypothetical protein
MTNADYIQLAALAVVTVYTFVTWRLLAAQRKQSFDNNFFNLLSLHHEVVNGIERYVVNLPVRGRRNFEAFYTEFESQYKSQCSQNPNEKPEVLIKNAYLEFFKSRQPDIGHYFRNLYHIIKYVHESRVSKKKKKFYTHLVRAQLSSHELLLLFYNCLSPLGNEKFKPLVERYSLLENMPEGQLASDKLNQTFDHRKLYDPKAFSEECGGAAQRTHNSTKHVVRFICKG